MNKSRTPVPGATYAVFEEAQGMYTYVYDDVTYVYDHVTHNLIL